MFSLLRVQVSSLQNAINAPVSISFKDVIEKLVNSTGYLGINLIYRHSYLATK